MFYSDSEDKVLPADAITVVREDGKMFSRVYESDENVILLLSLSEPSHASGKYLADFKTSGGNKLIIDCRSYQELKAALGKKDWFQCNGPILYIRALWEHQVRSIASPDYCTCCK